MNYRYQPPHQDLSDAIRTVLIVEGFAPSIDTGRPFYTKGMSALICYTSKDENGKELIKQLAFYGNTTSAETWDVRENETLLAYFFMPFVMTSMFNIAAKDLTNAPLDLHSWHAHKTNALKTQLAYASTTLQKVEALDSLCIHQKQLQQNEMDIIRLATDRIIENAGKEILADIRHELHITERTLQRVFKKYVGTTPNQFRRICQFQLSITQLKTGRFDTLTDVAFHHGFADQSHFIRSFKEFTEQTPTDYIRTGLKPKKE